MSTTPAKKTARRKTPPVADLPMPEIDVLELSSAGVEDAEPDLVEIFRLDGKSYYIDRNRGAGAALRMLKTTVTEGEQAALGMFLVEVLGEEAFDALSNFPGVTVPQMAQVMMSCTKALLGDEKAGPKA